MALQLEYVYLIHWIPLFRSIDVKLSSNSDRKIVILDGGDGAGKTSLQDGILRDVYTRKEYSHLWQI